MRAGIGFDVHRLVPGRRLVIGGVDIPHEKGLAGHSDADVLVHALCDALLGAAALGDIGSHFPDTHERYRDIDSLVLLREVSLKVREKGYAVNNVDATVMAEAPKLAPHREAMRERIREVLGLPGDAVNIKATTTEGLGFTGRGEGVAAMCVATLRPATEEDS